MGFRVCKMKLEKHEGNQLSEATKIWFAKNGGAVDIKIKQVKTEHKQEKILKKPKGFDNA